MISSNVVPDPRARGSDRLVYHDNGKAYYEVELHPQDGPYLLPYVARRSDGSSHGVPFEEADVIDPKLNYGGRQFFYPDASRMFADIDRTIAGPSLYRSRSQ